MTENVKRDKMLKSFAEGDSFQDDQYRRYQEEISNLKSMLFAEFRVSYLNDLFLFYLIK